MKYLDLFAGIGGFRSGLSYFGDFFVPVGYCEINPYVRRAYEAMYDTVGEKCWEDVRSIVPAEIPDIDLICGGFPCQSFSVAGRRGGFEDARGTLFFEIARIAKEKRPTYLLLENVVGLLSHDNGQTFAAILNTLSELGYGGGTIAVYNEELVLKALTDFGYSREEAVRFANDGCWEVQIPGKTNFGYIPFDALQLLQHRTLKDYGDDVAFESFEALYAAFIGDLTAKIQGITVGLQNDFSGKNADGTWKWKPEIPCTVVSLFEADCIGRGLSYYEGGAVYNVRSPHIGGIADTVNSLYAIKKLVFDDRVISFAELMQTLRKNWAGAETLRLYAKNHYRYYGNDSGEADELYRRLVHDFAECCRRQEGQCGYRLPAGISTFGRQLEWRVKRLACAHGTKAGDILAGNASPTPGTDGEGATAVICSYCRADLSEMTTGAALDLKLLPSVVKGDTGVRAMVALLRGFVRLGGFFLQLDVADAKILHEAQAHPEDYQTLSVRVSGWNARFVTLDRSWQQMIIEQMEK